MKVKAIEKISDSVVQLIDQTKLPQELSYLKISDYQDMILAIQRLEVRGAPAIGIAAAYGLCLGVVQSGRFDLDYINNIGNEIKASRPTAVNLFWAVDRMIAQFTEHNPTDIETAKAVLWESAKQIHDEDRELCRKIGLAGAELISDGSTVLTHCNAGALATGGIGTALGVIYTCRDQGKKIKVFADETRPLLQGARLTTWELQQEGIDVTLICDNTAGMVMRQRKIDHIIVGADRIAANGDFANKIGTYSVAVLAKEHGIPFYVAAPYSTFDRNIANGDGIEIELRSAEEVTNGFGKRTAPEGIEVYSPAFDITPVELVTYYITDNGIHPGGGGASSHLSNIRSRS